MVLVIVCSVGGCDWWRRVVKSLRALWNIEVRGRCNGWSFGRLKSGVCMLSDLKCRMCHHGC